MAEHPLKTSRELSARELLLLALSAGEAGQRDLSKMSWRADETATASRRAAVYARLFQLVRTENWDDFLRVVKGQEPAIPEPPVEVLDRE